jgi:hypothetical protein
LKRQKLDHQHIASQAQQPKQQKLAIPITVPITSNQQQQKSSTALPAAVPATNVPSSSHSNPNQFGSQQKITSSLTADADKKREQQPQQQPAKFNHIESTYNICLFINSCIKLQTFKALQRRCQNCNLPAGNSHKTTLLKIKY